MSGDSTPPLGTGPTTGVRRKTSSSGMLPGRCRQRSRPGVCAGPGRGQAPAHGRGVGGEVDRASRRGIGAGAELIQHWY